MARPVAPAGPLVCQRPDYTAPAGPHRLPFVPSAYDEDAADEIGATEGGVAGLWLDEDAADEIGATEGADGSTTTLLRQSVGVCPVLNSFVRSSLGRAALRTAATGARRGGAAARVALVAARRGVSCVCGPLARVSAGRSRTARTETECYAVYVGRDAMPDFLSPPAATGTTLPIDLSVEPPESGSVALWVVVRRRNKYGLESQNTQPQIILYNAEGDEELGPITTPQILNVVSTEGDNFRIHASYQGFYADRNPADKWRLYVGEGIALLWEDGEPLLWEDGEPLLWEDVGELELAGEADITAEQMTINVGPYSQGGRSYLFVLRAYRTEDEASAETLYSVALPPDPDVPVPVLGEFIA